MALRSPIKRFKPRHDLVVLLHMQGRKNVEIAKSLDMTPEHVHGVLQDPKALMMIEKYRLQVQTHFMDDVETRLLGLGAAAAENIAETIEAEVPIGSRVKKHQDEVSFKLLDRIGFTPKTRGDDGGGAVKFDRDIQERLAKALEHTRQIHEYDEVEEAEWLEGSDTVTSKSTGSGRDLGASDNGAGPNAPEVIESARSTGSGEMAPSPLVLPNGDDKK